MENGHIVVKFLVVGNVRIRERFGGDDKISIHRFTSGTSFEVESLYPLISDASDKFQKGEMLHEAMKMLFKPLNCYPLTGSSTIWKDCITRNCCLFVISLCFDIWEAKDICCIHHGTKVQSPCLRCVFLLHDVQGL